jgi:hypothetical protein
MTDDALFDDPATLLAAANLIEIRDATSKPTRRERLEAESQRDLVLIGEGYVVRRGDAGATVYKFSE